LSRIDKYDPYDGGFRAPLNAAIVDNATTHNAGKVFAVSLNTSGRVVIGGTAAADIVGVICPVGAMNAGDIVDVMTDGEIVDFTLNDGSAATAGTRYLGGTDGNLSTTTGGANIGWTIEAGRLVVRLGR
jgi:phosphatidylserine decarboxylase